MPIACMCSSREEAEKIVGATNIRDVSARYNLKDGEQIWIADTHVGLCISEEEANYADDSDFHMLVWNPIEMCSEQVCFGSTRTWCYPSMDATRVDATPEVLAAYAEYREQMKEKARVKRLAAALNTPKIGKKLTVVKGKKVPVGFTGECFWMGQKFGKQRVGIKEGDVKYFVDARFVAVVQPELPLGCSI